DEKRDLDSTYSTEAIKQLIELGYIDEPDEDAKKSAENVADEIKYNLAQVYYNTNRRHLAKPLLTELFDKYPHRGRYFFKLNECLLDEGNIKQCRDLIKVFKTSAEKKVLSQVQINHLKTRKPPEILNKKEKAQWLKKVISDPIGESKQAINDLFNLNFTEGNLLIHEGQMRKAIRKYRETEKLAPKKNAFFSKMGNAFLRLSQWRDAEEMFRKVLANYEEDENANLGLGISLFHQKKYQESLDVLLDAVYLNFYSAKNHYYIGATLSELKRFDEAAQSFEIALKINPNFGVCRNRLIVLYDESLGNSEKAKNLRITETSIENSNGQSIDIATDVLIRPKADRLSQTPIIVVSGLPRSGTSMMMQLLDAAGVPIYTDEKRKPDNSNPQGYFEHDKVKQLIRNNAWMEEATGKAVKIVVPLLYKIPAAFTYKVIFMERNLDEIIESQHQMLIESSKMKNDTYAVQIENSFKKQLHEFEAWKKRNPNAEVLNINYNEAIDKKAETVSKVFGFLNIDANQETLANIIDKNLYRTKKN
ncbi:MAG: tetratricopeptide repeat protein, partial [Prolixibacteraceae bacterium]|nr:tetratricopeptide repeat protein [Prolixibacteraceae bacterium]